MPFDHHVEIQVRLLCLRHPGLDVALVNEPHLLAALVSRRLDARDRANAIALILRRQDIAAAKALLRLQPFMEKVELEAISLEFEGFDCSPGFNHDISSLMPADSADQRHMLALLAKTVPRTSEQVGKWFARLFREQGYELTDASIALLCLYVWFSQNPVTSAGRLVHRVWDVTSTLGEAASQARTFGRWLRLTLLASDDGLPAWFPGCSFGGLDITPIASAAEARDIAGLFDPGLYPAIADKLHAGTASFFIARRSKGSDIVGFIEIAALHGRGHHIPADIRGRPDIKSAAKLLPAAYHLLETAHRPAGGLKPTLPRRLPDAAILALRWGELFGPYFADVGPGLLFPEQPDASTMHRLTEAIEELGRVATGPRQP